MLLFVALVLLLLLWFFLLFSCWDVSLNLKVCCCVWYWRIGIWHSLWLESYLVVLFWYSWFCLGSQTYVMFWPSTRPKEMLFQGDAPEGSDTFQWPVIERDRVGGLRLIIWDKVKVPLFQYRLMHLKRVTSELHDSYFRLMTIKHSISKIQWAIMWALNYYLTQLSSSPRSSCQ